MTEEKLRLLLIIVCGFSILAVVIQEIRFRREFRARKAAVIYGGKEMVLNVAIARYLKDKGIQYPSFDELTPYLEEAHTQTFGFKPTKKDMTGEE